MNTSPAHRGSQAGRLADELRLIASGQAAASLALATAGKQLAADAMAETPLPREYSLQSSGRKRVRLSAGEKSRGKSPEASNTFEEDGGQRPEKPGQERGTLENTVVGVGLPAGEPDDERGATPDTGNGAVAGGAVQYEAEYFQRGESNLPSARAAVNASIAIDAAACREEVAAAARIQSFLRRRGQWQVRPAVMRQAPVESVSLPAIGPSSDDQRSIDSTTEWFELALRHLRREIDNYLLGDEQQDSAGGGDSKASSLIDTGNQAQELEPDGKSAACRLSSADDGCRADDETAETANSTESSGYDNDEDWLTFPPVPLRARAPSLYTLPAPGSTTGERNALADDGGNSSGVAACSDRSTAAAGGQGGVFTKLGPEIVARLSSARSVFCLRAADVLAAFSPPPPSPPPCSSSSSPLGASPGKSKDTVLGPRPSTVPGRTVGRGGGLHRGGVRLSSPDALRYRLRREAEEASRAGFGRPWLLSPHKTRAPTRHKQDQGQLSAFIRERNGARSTRGGGGIEQKREERRRADFFGSWTPLGRRLAKRYNAGRAARRRRVLGETDQFRAKHAGRRLRSEAATNALEGVERALDLRLSARRERRVPPAHVTELLDIVDRYVFSDSQVFMMASGPNNTMRVLQLAFEDAYSSQDCGPLEKAWCVYRALLVCR